MPRIRMDGTRRVRFGLPPGAPDDWARRWHKWVILFDRIFIPTEWDGTPIEITRRDIERFAVQHRGVPPLARKASKRERQSFSNEITHFWLQIGGAALAKKVCSHSERQWQIKKIVAVQTYQIITMEKSVANGFEQEAIEGFV